MNKGESGLSVLQNITKSVFSGRHNPAPGLFVYRPTFLPIFPRRTKTIMTKLRLVLLATTALTAMQFVSAPSHAQTAPLVIAQAAPAGELGPDAKPKQPPKGAPPKAAPPKAAPPPPRPAPPAAPPQ